MDGRYKRTVAPTVDPITLSEAKDQCSISGTEDYDTYLAALIDRATETIEKHLDRQILTSTWTLSLDAFPDEVRILKPPVTAVSSVVYTDTAGDDQTLSSANYQTDFSTQDGVARISPAYGLTWPSTRAVYNAVVVTFVCGYADAASVPYTLKHAVAFLVAHWFRQREPVVVGTIASTLPIGIEVLLATGDWGAYS